MLIYRTNNKQIQVTMQEQLTQYRHDSPQISQIRFLLSILQEMQLKNQFQQLCHCSISASQDDKLLSLIHIFQGKVENNLDYQALDNYYCILALKILNESIRIQTGKQNQQLAKLYYSCPLLHYKQLERRQSILAAIQKNMKQVVNDDKIIGTFINHTKEYKSNSYYLLQMVYYYHLKLIFIQKYQFQEISVIQKKLATIKLIYKEFYIDFCKELRYLSKKLPLFNHVIDEQTTIKIIALISSQKIYSKIRICLSQLLRNIIRNGYQCPVQDLIHIATTTDIDQIKSSIYQSIILFEKSDTNAKAFLNKVIQNSKDCQINRYFIQKRMIHQIDKLESSNNRFFRGKHLQNINSFVNIENHSLRQRTMAKKLFTSKDGYNINLSKITVKNTNQEQRQSLIVHPDIQLKAEIQGNDRSWLRGTFQQIKNLYTIAQKDGILKKQDKDQYIPHKFMNKKQKNFSKGRLGSFLIDKMIARILFIISKSQKLTKKTVESIINKCIKSYEQFKKELFQQQWISEQKLVDQFQRNLKEYSRDTYEVYQDNKKQIKKFIVNISKNIDRTQKVRILKQQIDQIRVDTIATLYNVLLADLHSEDLSKSIRYILFVAFQRYLQNHNTLNSEFFNYFVRICSIKYYSHYFIKQDKNWNNILFNGCINYLENEKSKELALVHLVEQAQKQSEHQIIFNNNEIYLILRAITKQTNRDYLKSMMNILVLYLLNVKQKPIEIDELQQIQKNIYFKVIKIQYYTAYFLNMQKYDEQTIHQIVDKRRIMQLMKQYQKLTGQKNQEYEKTQNIILLILSNIFNAKAILFPLAFNSEMNEIYQVNMFSPNLKNQQYATFQNNQFVFSILNQINQFSDQDSFTISEAVASIIYFNVQNGSLLSNNSLTEIFKQIKIGKARTRMILSKTIKKYSERGMLSKADSANLSQSLRTENLQIRINLIFAYLSIKQNQDCFDLNDLNQVLCQQTILIDNIDVSLQINNKILSIIHRYMSNNLVHQFKEGRIFKIISYFLQSKQLQFISKSLDILCVYSSKYWISGQVLQQVDKISQRKFQFTHNQMEGLLLKKEIIYSNLIKNQQQIPIKQVQILTHKLLSCSNMEEGKIFLQKLKQISHNQDLPQEIFDIIELQRCCERLSQVEKDLLIEDKIIEMTQQGVRVNTQLHFKVITEGLNPSSIQIIYNVSINQRIPMKIIQLLLAIYVSNNLHNGNNKNQILIAKTAVNTYLQYEDNQILNKDIFFTQSVKQTSLLQIVLPLLLKKKYKINQRDKNILRKIIQFYQSNTASIQQKQSISFLFTNKNNLSLLESMHNINKLLDPQNKSTQSQRNNCIKGMKILGYNIKPKELINQDNIQKQKIQQQTQTQKNVLSITKLQSGLRQDHSKSAIISSKIISMLFPNHQPLNNIQERNNQLQETQSKKQDIKEMHKRAKRDYLYCKQDLKIILQSYIHQCNTQELSKQTFCKLEQQYLEILIRVSSIHQSHIYEGQLINNQYFINLVQKALIHKKISIQILQIYVKIIVNKKSRFNQQIFDNLLLQICTCQSQQVYQYVIQTFLAIIIHCHQQLYNIADKKSVNQILSILQSNILVQSIKTKYISSKCLRILGQNIGQLKEKVQLLFKQKLKGVKSDNIQIITILQQIPQSKKYQKQQITNKIICEILTKGIINKICKDQLSKVKFISLMLQCKQFHQYQMRLQVLAEIYINITTSTDFQNVYDFVKYCLFNQNPLFKTMRKELINDIKNHKFMESKLTKMMSHRFCALFDVKGQQFLHLCQGQSIISIALFCSQAIPLKKQQIQNCLEQMYQHQIKLEPIIGNPAKLSLVKIYAISILQLLQKQGFKIQSGQNQLYTLVQNILFKYTVEQIEKTLKNIIEKLQVKEIDAIIQFLSLIVHYPKQNQNDLVEIVTLSLQTSKTTMELFQNIQQNYFKRSSRKQNRRIFDCASNVQIYPPQYQQTYSRNLQNELSQTDNVQYRNYMPNSQFRPPTNLMDWKDSDFRGWSRWARKNKDYTSCLHFIKQALCIIKAAICKANSDHKLRNNQLLSCLLILNQYQTINKKGRLLQISTGQGKSTIICAVAIVLSLKGHQVDIITTTSILAKRDSQIFKRIYDFFEISVANNIDSGQYLQGPKKCYECDVVYGQVSQFQFDYLRDHYNNYGTLGGRKNIYAVVDQVDSMLIDDSSKIAKISTNIAGMDKLQILYVLIWQKIMDIKSNTMQYQEKSYYFDGSIEEKQDLISFYYKDNEGQQAKIEDIQAYMEKVYKKQVKIVEKIRQIKNFDKQAQQILLGQRQQILKDIHIPSNFIPFVEKQFPRWIQSAIQAYHYQQNVNYIIQNQVISPVDYDNTGKVQQSTNWSNGLHQFLQLKHFLKLTPQNLTTNFMSNITYFKLYQHIFGVTGTIGSQTSKRVLSTCYQVDIIKIPDSYQKSLINYPVLVSWNVQEWIEKIVRQVQFQIHKNRGILIICQTIQDCNYISYSLKNSSALKITLYTMNDKNQQQQIKQIKCKEVVIATNLAGRGTDIKTKQIEPFGGLHVIITFLPKNLRVQEQAKGRTSRKGNHGSCQIIINKELLPHISDFTQIMKSRDDQQKEYLDNFMKQQKDKVQMKDSIFLQFCNFLKQVRKQLKSPQITSQSKSLFNSALNAAYNEEKKQQISLVQYQIYAIEQRWAFFLNQDYDIQSFKGKFQQFKDQINEDIQRRRVIKNPYYLVQVGNDLINKKMNYLNPFKYFGNQNLIRAKQYFEQALEIDPKIVSAWTGLGQICIRLKDHKQISKLYYQVFGTESNRYKQLALHYYQKAQQLLKEQLVKLLIVRQYSSLDQSERKSLMAQIQRRHQILMIFYNNIKEIIKQISKSQKLVTITQYSHGNQQDAILYQQIRRKKQYPFINDEQGKLLQVRFHDLNSNADDQSSDVLKQLQLFADDFDQQIDLVNLQLNNLKAQQVNIYLLNSKIKANLNTKQARKFIKKQLKKINDESTYQSNIHSKFNNKTQEFQGISPSLQYLDEHQYVNDRYKVTITNSKLRKEFIEEIKFTIICQDSKGTSAGQIINLIQCQSYSVEVESSHITYKFQELKQFLDKSTEQMVFVSCNKIEQDRKTKLTRKSIKFTKQNFLNHIQTKIIFKVHIKQKLQQIIVKFRGQPLVISFFDCKSVKFFPSFENCEFSLLFNQPQKSSPLSKINKIKQIIKITQQIKNKQPYDLIIRSLSKQQLQRLVFYSQIDSQDLRILQKRSILDFFPKATAPLTQIYQYLQHGLHQILIIRQKNKLPESTLLILSGICFLQLILGALLVPVLSPVGVFLLVQSAIDMVTIISVASTREFDWQIYAIFKLVSFALFSQAVAIGSVGRSILQVVGAFKTKIMQLGAQIIPAPQVVHLLKKYLMRSKEGRQMYRAKNANNQYIPNHQQYRRIVEQSVHSIVEEYYKDRVGVHAIVKKMGMLDYLDQQHGWQNKIQNAIKETIYCQEMQVSIQKILQQIGAGEQRNIMWQIIHLKNNHNFNKIINDKCLLLARRLYLMQRDVPKLNQILRKYSDMNHQDIDRRYEQLIRQQGIIKQILIVNDGREEQYQYQLIQQSSLENINRQYDQKLREYLQNDQAQSIQGMYKSIRKSISDLFMSKLLKYTRNPSIKQFITYNKCNLSRNSRTQLKKQVLHLSRSIQHQLIILREQQKLKQAMSKYSELIMIKQASPIDMLILLQQFNLKIKLVNEKDAHNLKIGQECILYRQQIFEGQAFYIYSLSNSSQQDKNAMDEGFYQIYFLLDRKINIYGLRKHYSQIIGKKQRKLIQYVNSFHHLYIDQQVHPENSNFNSQRIQVSKNFVGFRSIINKYERCSLLQRMIQLQDCIREHVAIYTTKKGQQIQQETIQITLSYQPERREGFERLLQMIKQYNVEAHQINGSQKIRIDNTTLEINRKVIIKACINRKAQ